MAHELHKPLHSYGPDAREAYCLFTTADTAAPTVLENQGFITIARSGVGTFLLTLKHASKGAYYVVSVMKEFTTDAQTIVITGQDAVTAKTITLKTVTAASANTAVETTGMKIHVTVKIRMAQ